MPRSTDKYSCVADQETRQFQHGKIREWFFLSVVSRYLAAVE
jgi:hypothetical protein